MPSVSNEINKLIKSTSYNEVEQTVEISYMDDTKITIPVDSMADFNASNPSQMIDLTNYIYTPYSKITVEIDHGRTMHNRNSDGTLSFIFGVVKGIRKIDEKTVCLPNSKLMPLFDLYHCLKIKAHHNIDYRHGYASFYKGEALPYQILGFDSNGMEIKVQTYKFINRQKCSIKRTDIIINDESFLIAEIDGNENNIKSLPSKKQDYLPQLSLNRGDKYALVLQGEEDFQNIERTYVVVEKIDKLNNIEIDAVIVKQIGGDNTTIFSLTKADCKELDIKYVPGLQLFPANMDWKQLETNYKEYSTDGEKKQDKNDLQKHCRIQGQTPTDYIGISIDNNLPKDNFVVTWLLSKDNSNNEEEDIEPYWQFTKSEDFYEEYLPYFDKNEYFNLKKKYANS